MSDPSIQDLFPSPISSSSSTSEQDPEALLSQALKNCPSVTSQADLLAILQLRLTVSFAKTHDCECIIWGHSTTRLAERTLAEVAKGRGFALHLVAAEGASPHGIPVHYPCRDLLSNEITSFADLSEPPLSYLADERSSSAAAPAVSSKQATIDSLMQQYFVSAEKEYPSIVANVVRTAAKLQSNEAALIEQQCELCEMPLAEGNAPQRSRLCYACLRVLPARDTASA